MDAVAEEEVEEGCEEIDDDVEDESEDEMQLTRHRGDKEGALTSSGVSDAALHAPPEEEDETRSNWTASDASADEHDAAGSAADAVTPPRKHRRVA